MGSIMERPRKSGGISYQAMVRVYGGKPIVKTFGDRETAEDFVARMEKEVESARLALAMNRPCNRTMARGALLKGLDVSELSLDEEAAKKVFANERLMDTFKKYVNSGCASEKAKNGIKTMELVVGDVLLGQVKKRWVRQFVSHMRSIKTQHGKTYEYSTILGYLSMINCAMRWRSEELDLPYNRLPCSKFDLLPSDYSNERNRRLDHKEWISLRRALRKVQGSSNRHYRLLTYFAVATGARLQEMVLAEWEEVDLEKRTWIIPAAHTKMKQERMVPLTARAMKILKALERMKDPSRSEIFHLLGNTRSVSTVFTRIVRRSGVKDFHFHDLRHEGITQMVVKQRQLSVFEIMQMVGHNSLSMLKRYTNLRGDELVKKLL